MRGRTYLVVVAFGLLLAVALWAVLDGRNGDGTPAGAAASRAAAAVKGLDGGDESGVVGGPAGAPVGVRSDSVAITEEDREIFRRRMERARAERWDTLEIGQVMVRLGRSFLGSRYTPGTLELPGPERLVVNLRELDCVTFVENVLALSRVVRSGSTQFDRYLEELERIRYRDGTLDGYTSRLHYFSEWLTDNEASGLIRVLTPELGGVPDPEPITFMSTHADLYPQLADPGVRAAIAGIEAGLSERPRHYIPESGIEAAAPGIRDGDIIAATSTVAGLDVAHTGIAVHIDGALHLMHAPLVGREVEISERPLAERIRRITGQDGIMVARPR